MSKLLPTQLSSDGLLRWDSWRRILPWAVGIVAAASVTQMIIRMLSLYRRKKKVEKELLKYFKKVPQNWSGSPKTKTQRGKAMFKAIANTEELGSPYVTFQGPLFLQLIITDPEHIKSIYNTSEPKDPVGYYFLKSWLGDGLLISSGKKWSRNRRLLTPSFHFDILRPYQEVFSDCTNALVDKWRTASNGSFVPQEMFEHISLMTLDSLMRCIFGVESHFQTEKKRNPYIEAVYALSDLTVSRFLFLPYYSDLVYYFSPAGYRHRKNLKIVHGFSKRVIKQRKDQKKQASSNSDKRYRDFLDMLLDCRDTDGAGLTDKEIQDEVDTFMFEGHDTTASGISWCLYNLARHPEYQQKCRDEINSVLGDKQQVTWEDLNNIPFLTMCIKESLRLNPPVTATGRVNTQEVVCSDGSKIPPGTWIVINIYACHHNSSVWPMPEIYDPGRFTPENMKERHSHSFVPFSAGPRNCIGQHFAMNELKTCLAILLKNFEFLQDGSKLPEMSPDLVLRAKSPGMWLKVKSIQ